MSAPSAPSAADLASACAWLSERPEGIGIVVDIDNALGWGWYANGPGCEERSEMAPTLAECIIATARALGWVPPEPTVVRDEYIPPHTTGPGAPKVRSRGYIATGTLPAISPEERARTLRVAELVLSAVLTAMDDADGLASATGAVKAMPAAWFVDRVLGAGAR